MKRKSEEDKGWYVTRTSFGDTLITSTKKLKSLDVGIQEWVDHSIHPVVLKGFQLPPQDHPNLFSLGEYKIHGPLWGNEVAHNYWPSIKEDTIHGIYVCVFIQHRTQYYVLWIKHPQGSVALPGGVCNPKGSPKETARQLIYQETGIQVLALHEICKWTSESFFTNLSWKTEKTGFCTLCSVPLEWEPYLDARDPSKTFVTVPIIRNHELKHLLLMNIKKRFQSHRNFSENHLVLVQESCNSLGLQ